MAESTLSAGARHGASVVVDGWTVAAAYDDPAREYAALRDDAALVDLAFRTRVRVVGADRVDFLQGMLSNDVRRLATGEGCRALLLTEQGKVVADCVVLALADALVLDARTLAIARALAALARYIVADDVELVPEDTTHAIGVFGPGANDALARRGITPPAASYAHELHETEVGPLRVVRVPEPGAGGFVCLVPRDRAEAWWRSCVDARIPRAGFEAFETLRIESGVPADGVDIGPETIALEAPLEAAISFGKGCYLGQEVIERVSARGHVNRRLVGLLIAAAAMPRAGDVIAAGDKEIGRVTSVAWSWRLEKPVALGYVRREHVAPGTRLEVRAAAGVLAATVQTPPATPTN
ncbi:MAG: aminomethyl transferase family protein [Deltaproteobacteria bacterium]|nr:aminomethyl transferase family protein [Deltaproteobacteria bacterium]